MQGIWTEVEESSFGFGFTNNLTAAKLLRYETSKYYSKNVELKFLPKLELNLFNSQISDQELYDQKRTGSLNEPLMLASDSKVKSPKSNLSGNSPLELKNVCKIADVKSEFEIIENPLKGSKITPKNFDQEKDTHPFDMDDILWGNLGNKLKEGCCKRFGFGLILCLMFFFLSTPTAILQAIKSQKFLQTFLTLGWAGKFPGVMENFIKNYFMTGLTLICNKLFMLVGQTVSEEKNFATKYRYHSYLMQISFFYMLLNMVIMPGLAISGVSSIYNIVNNQSSTEQVSDTEKM